MAAKKVAVTLSEPDRKHVGIWIRVSTEDQAKGDSPEHHEKRARYYAESKEWKIAETYHLEGVSGKAVLQHPEAKRMLDDIRRGQISGLIFSKLARLARNTRELLEFSDLFRAHNADLISLEEAIDTSTPAGRLFYTMIAAMAQWEREEIASRVAASVPIRAKLGKPLGGAAPYGYQWKDRKLVPDPAEAPIRKLLCDLFLEHRRKKTVARLLNEAGHRTRSGDKFSDTTVDRLLRDPIAKGQRRMNYTKSLGEKKHWKLKPESDWIINEVEPIISEDLWNQVNAILDEQRSSRKPPARKPVQLFAGLTYCVCGTKMYVPSNTPKYVCGKCRNKMPVEALEEVFHAQLKKFVFSPEEIAHYLSTTDEAIMERDQQLKLLERETEKIRREMGRIMQLYLDEEISKEGCGREYRPLEERLNQLEDQIPRLLGEMDFLKIQRLSSDEILSEAKDLYTRWPALSPDEKRHIVEQITERITIDREEVAIDLRYLAPPPGPPSSSTPSSSTPSTPSSSSFSSSSDGNMATQHHPCVAILPLRLSARKPRDSAYPKEPKTLGDHLRKKRLDLGLLQREVAEQLGVDEDSICHWEIGYSEPKAYLIPRIHAFLGFCPYTPPETFGAWLRMARQGVGLSRKRLAPKLGVDAGIIDRWEREEGRPDRATVCRIRRWFRLH